MPGDVAVHEPHARIVRFEGDDQEAARGEEGHVPARGVVVLEGEVLGGVEGAAGLLEDDEVVAVEVDLVSLVSKVDTL